MAKKATKAEVIPFTAPEPLTNPHTYEGLKSVFINVENFKNISAKVVNISGKSIAIVGKNEAGKSSLIQVIKGTLDSKNLPEVGLKEGSEEGRILHKIAGCVQGEYLEYTIEYFFNKGNKSGRLKVYDKDMQEVKSPATIIKSVIGSITFSPIKFLSLKKEEKLKILKQLTGCEKEIDIINYDIKAKKDSIKAKKDMNEIFEAKLNTTIFTDDQKRLYANPIPVEPINQKLNTVKQTADVFNNIKSQRDNFYNQTLDCDRRIQSAIEEHSRIDAEIIKLRERQKDISENITAINEAKKVSIANIETADKWMIENPAPDMVSIAEELRIATEHNANHRQILELADNHKSLFNQKQEVIALERDVDDLITKRTEVINGSQLPIPNISFTEDEILLNGLPLEDGQINTQTLWDVCIDIAMAVNPNYKGVFIDDGSLFDRDHLIATIKKIEARGGFAIVEIVDFNGGDLDVKFTEEEFK